MTEKTLKHGNPINKATQFGQPNGNPRGRGFWKKEETARWKFEQILKMSDEELLKIKEDTTADKLSRNTANIMLLMGNATDIKEATACVSGLCDIINQVYGYPKQAVEQTNIEPPAPRMAKIKEEE